jgi:hypothetical protein
MVVLPVIPALQRQRQKDHKLEASVGYGARPSLKETKQNKIFPRASESVPASNVQFLKNGGNRTDPLRTTC